jgi:hypothetical protein
MACNKCKSNKCGCGDAYLSMPANYLNCPDPCESNERCTQLYDMDCICYNGEDIVELDIKKGQRLTTVLKKLISRIENPDCSNYSSLTDCKNTVDVLITNITSSSINLQWNNVNTATGYIVEFKESASLTWNVNPVITLTTAQLIGLNPDTTYDVRIQTVCDEDSCLSLTYRIKTLNN